MKRSRLFLASALIALMGISASAVALDESDVGNYALIHRDGHVTDFISYLSYTGGKWNVEHLMPDGTWQNVTCERDCTLHESKPADLKRFFDADDLKQITPTCVHNASFAFCNYTMASKPGLTGYVLVGLTTKQPAIVQLKRLAPAWTDPQGRMVPDTDSRKAVDGFGGSLLATTDADWKKKWYTPEDTIPEILRASSVEYGGHLAILIFYTNPKTEADGSIKLLCDIRITKPDGTLDMDSKAVNCASGKIKGNPHNVRLSSTVVNFIGEEGDPPGIWRVEVSLTDKNRNVTVPLKTEFTLNKKPGGQAK
ncbi:MAG TPA: hypothetical protein VIU46_06450 [Gallionellaceae bacterium]